MRVVHIILAVEYLDSVDEDSVHSYRVANRPRTTTRQIVHSMRCCYAYCLGVEEQQISMGAGCDPSPVYQAVEVGRVAGQSPYALGEVEITTLAYPLCQKVQTEPCVTHEDQVGAGIRQGNDPGFVLQQLADTVVSNVEKLTDKGRTQVFLQAEIENHIQWVPSLTPCD